MGNELYVNPDKNGANIDKKRLDHYKGCIVTRDELVNEGAGARIDYVRMFGELNSSILSAKIECISKKKAIAYCQTVVNSGGSDVSGANLQSYIDKCMKDYHEELARMEKDRRACAAAKDVEHSVSVRVRRIYREMARKIHPDVNPDPYFKPFWLMLKDAYDTYDIDRLEELRILISDALRDHGKGEDFIPEGMTAEELERRISSIEEEIEDIIHTEPYTYKLILDSDDTIEEHRLELERQLNEYLRYSEELTEVLKRFRIIGGDKLQWIRI